MDLDPTEAAMLVSTLADCIPRRETWPHRVAGAAVTNQLAQWETVIGVQVADWRVKQMKTKWGTYNVEAQRIWLNLELAKKSPRCLEYIIVHEMVHLLERHHNDHFAGLMNKFMPQWRLHREELNRSALGHEEWGYERGPLLWTGKLMLLYQLVRRNHETYPTPNFHGRIQT